MCKIYNQRQNCNYKKKYHNVHFSIQKAIFYIIMIFLWDNFALFDIQEQS